MSKIKTSMSKRVKEIAPERRRPVERSSPCAGKCRHVWCRGYEVGYSDGYEDGRDAALERRLR